MLRPYKPQRFGTTTWEALIQQPHRFGTTCVQSLLSDFALYGKRWSGFLWDGLVSHIWTFYLDNNMSHRLFQLILYGFEHSFFVLCSSILGWVYTQIRCDHCSDATSTNYFCISGAAWRVCMAMLLCSHHCFSYWCTLYVRLVDCVVYMASSTCRGDGVYIVNTDTSCCLAHLVV